MTGRSEGYCVSAVHPSFTAPVFSRGWFGPARGCRRGAGRGRGRGLFRRGLKPVLALPSPVVNEIATPGGD
jgi:hypothetical protein